MMIKKEIQGVGFKGSNDNNFEQEFQGSTNNNDSQNKNKKIAKPNMFIMITKYLQYYYEVFHCVKLSYDVKMRDLDTRRVIILMSKN